MYMVRDEDRDQRERRMREGGVERGREGGRERERERERERFASYIDNTH